MVVVEHDPDGGWRVGKLRAPLFQNSRFDFTSKEDMVPDDFVGKRTVVGETSMMMIVKSLAVASVSKRDEPVLLHS